jgi:peptidoglycan hydrolase CwlO-like protein
MIKKLKKEKDKISNLLTELETSQESQIAAKNGLKAQLDQLRSESKQGEAILVTQLKELR